MKYYNKEKYKLSLLIIMYMFIVCILYNFFKLFKIVHCLTLIEILSVIIPIVYYFVISKKEIQKKSIITITIYLILVLIIPFLFGKTYDLTVDGNSYHKTAIGLMNEGWNPIYESSKEFNSGIVDKIEKLDLWIDHYPKSSYFIATSIYSLTGNIESGKCITFLASVSLGLLLISILEEKIKKRNAYILGIIICLNPIVLSQIFTYYIDGLMGILFAIELLLLSQIDAKNFKYNNEFLYLMSCIGVFVNLKFTGLLYSGIIAAVYYFYWLLKNKKDRLEVFKNITIKFIIIYVVAIGFIGMSSYVKNTIEHKNPLYPLIGKNKVDIITTMEPKVYNEMNSLEKFINSTFSKTENMGYYGEKPKIKNPFIIYETELKILNLPDIRIGGFGPYWAVVIIVSLISLMCLSKDIYNSIKKKQLNMNILLPIIAIVLSIIMVGESWWARYIPQLYYLVIMLIYCLIDKKNKISIILIMLVVFNSYLFIKEKKDIFYEYKSINEDIVYMQNREINELKLTNNDQYGLLYNLNDKKIKYIINNKLTDEEIVYKYSWKFKYKE